MLESDIEQEAVDLIWEWLGIKGSKLKILGENAFPDRIFWLPGGKPLLIEFKQPGEDPRPLQAENHDNLRELGYEVQVHDNALEAFDAVITALEACKIPKAGRKILATARERWVVLKTREQEDIMRAGGVKSSV